MSHEQILWTEPRQEGGDRSCLVGTRDFDVAIVGAGYSGLWTAYYLSRIAPGLSVAILEAEVVGHGASGRNGGWCTGTLSGIDGLLEDPRTREPALALQRAVFDAVDEVGRIAAKEAIDCDYRKGGSIHLATNEPQRASLRRHLAHRARLGLEEADEHWLDAEDCARHLRSPRTLGGVFTPHCASLHPARLARGLALAAERAGVHIFEGTPVRRLGPGLVETEAGRVRAGTVLRATEAYTRRLPAERRRFVPLHSMMIATEPLPAEVWSEIGLERGETFGDGRRVVIYGQRTADGRMAFGARGEYRFGSGIEEVFAADDPRFEEVRRALVEVLPVLEGARITHRWGGPLGVPRDFRPSVGLDPATRVGWLGGYVGQGVAASNLAGRTLADLVAGEESPRTRLPWVGALGPRWEPEPLRWMAIRAVAGAGGAADRHEQRTGRPAGLSGRLFDWFASH